MLAPGPPVAVAILVQPGCSASEIRTLLARFADLPASVTRLVSMHEGPIETVEGELVLADGAFEDVPSPALVLLPSGRPITPVARVWVAAALRQGAWLCVGEGCPLGLPCAPTPSRSRAGCASCLSDSRPVGGADDAAGRSAGAPHVPA